MLLFWSLHKSSTLVGNVGDITPSTLFQVIQLANKTPVMEATIKILVSISASQHS